MMVRDCYDKIKPTKIQRYYILSTAPLEEDENIEKYVELAKEEHGCQIIINGIFQTIKDYLRLIQNTDLFMENYLKNLSNHPEINHEHEISWNTIVGEE